MGGRLIDRLTALCGSRCRRCGRSGSPRRRRRRWPAGWRPGRARLGDLLRDPDDRDGSSAVPLLVLRGDEAVLAPDDDFVLAPDDELLLAGQPAARRALDTTLLDRRRREYVVTGRHVPAGWIWRRLTADRESHHAHRRPPAGLRRVRTAAPRSDPDRGAAGVFVRGYPLMVRLVTACGS